MKSLLCCGLTAAVMILWCAGLQAQDIKNEKQDQHVLVETNDGNQFFGKLTERMPDTLVLELESLGELRIPWKIIRRIEYVPEKRLKKGAFWIESPDPTRNIFGPTGYGLKKEQGFYQNFMLVLHQLSYGVTDNFSIGFGFEIATLIAGLNDGTDGGAPFFWFTPKFSVPVVQDEFNLGVGALLGHIPETEAVFNIGMLYGVGTIGSKDHNLSLGLGYGFIEGDFARLPAFSLSGTTRLSNGFALVTENWLIPTEESTGGIISFGGRVIAQRISWDFALFAVGGEGDFFVSPIPLVGATVKLGK